MISVAVVIGSSLKVMLAHLFKVTVASLLVIIAAMHFVVAVAEVDVG